MNNLQAIKISIDASELESFCNKILKRSRNITKTHDALITLESFIAVFGRASHGTKEYQLIESTIKAITEKSRELLLEKNTHDLIRSLKQCNVTALANIHTPLSRNGFYQILQTAIGELTDDDIRLLMLWSENWVKEARQLAEEASGYPDARDFIKAGINIEEFQAMSDIDRVLNIPE